MNKSILKAAAIGMLSAAVLSACTKSSTGRNQIMLFSEAELSKMGSQSFEELKKKEKISNDRALNNYVQCVANAVTKQVPSTVHAGNWEVVVFDSKQVNAFALPGGKIGVYTGILDVAKGQDQLAAIIGHEIGHVIEHHSNERLSANQLAQVGLTLTAVALESTEIENKRLIQVGAAFGVQYFGIMPYSRGHESEADIVGQDLMAQAGFKPNAAISLWQNMAKVSKGAPPEFLSTHPSNQTRINALSEHLSVSQAKYNASVRPNCKR